MKRFTFNKQFMVLMFLLLNCFASYAADEDLITKQITIKLTEAGTLPNKIGSSKKNLITNLKIIGEINGTDLRFIREMAGRDVKGDSTSGNLSVLDLSEARIVEGGDYYGIFYSDQSMDYYYFATSNNTIGAHAFRQCNSLRSVKIPSSVTKIGYMAFYGCESLTSVNIPPSVTMIEQAAFLGCKSLTSVNIPSSVTSIEMFTFSGCTSLKDVSIPSSVTKICSCVFWGCTSLTSVSIPSSVTNIGDRAFLGCKSLTSVNIPSSVTKIYNNTFLGCTSLTSVNIPSSVTEIEDDAFRDCESLKSIFVFAEDVPSTDKSAFNGCDSKNCVVYVPKGTYDEYRASGFGYFENIFEFDATTSIHNTIATPEVKETARYAVNGQRLTAPIKGINLVKYSDGTVKKVFVK